MKVPQWCDFKRLMDPATQMLGNHPIGVKDSIHDQLLVSYFSCSLGLPFFNDNQLLSTHICDNTHIVH